MHASVTIGLAGVIHGSTARTDPPEVALKRLCADLGGQSVLVVVKGGDWRVTLTTEQAAHLWTAGKSPSEYGELLADPTDA